MQKNTVPAEELGLSICTHSTVPQTGNNELSLVALTVPAGRSSATFASYRDAHEDVVGIPFKRFCWF